MPFWELRRDQCAQRAGRLRAGRADFFFEHRSTVFNFTCEESQTRRQLVQTSTAISRLLAHVHRALLRVPTGRGGVELLSETRHEREERSAPLGAPTRWEAVMMKRGFAGHLIPEALGSGLDVGWNVSLEGAIMLPSL